MASILQAFRDPQILLAAVTALAVFATAACLVQALWSAAGDAVRRRAARQAARAALPWLAGAVLSAVTTEILWADSLAVFRTGPDPAALRAVRPHVPKPLMAGLAQADLYGA